MPLDRLDESKVVVEERTTSERGWQGDEALARRALDALDALAVEEPGFSAGAMAEPDYPVTTLRAAGLLGVAWAPHMGGRSAGAERRRRGGGRTS